MENHVSNKNINNNSIIFAIFAFVSLIFFTFGQSIFPGYFKWDSANIRLAMTTNYSEYYNNAAHFYTLLGFHSYTPQIYFQLFSWIIFIFLLLTIIRINKGNEFTTQQILLLILFTIIFAGYFATISKDLILILFTILAVNIFLSTRNYYTIIIVIYLYSYYYRNYWEIIVVLFLLTLLFNINKFKSYWIPFLTVILIVYYNFVIGSPITNYRLGVNVGRQANSMIFNLIPNTSIFTDVVNYFYVLISMFIPIQGIKSLNPVFYYVCVWFIIYLIYVNKKKLNIRIMYLVLTYFSFQACYEPDFGSALRHMMGLFLFIYLFLFDEQNDKKAW